jgi:colanic acid biosynthesis glycosyl transferase WcaI
MHVLITTQVFPPEIHPTAVMVAELARDLVSAGWNVSVACGLPHHPTGRILTAFKKRAITIEQSPDGYEIRRLWHPTSTIRSIPVRSIVMVGQSASTFLMGLTGDRPDVVLSFGGPPILGPLFSASIASIFEVPLVTVIHDIYPDVLRESGKLSNSFIFEILKRLESLQYRLSKSLIVLGTKTRDTLASRVGVDASRVYVVPVWLDPNEITPKPRNLTLRRTLGIDDDKLVIFYAGTVGIVSGGEILIDVARRLPNKYVIVVIGGGSAWTTLKTNSDRDPQLKTKLVVLPYQPRANLSDTQSISDLSLVTLAPGRGRTSVPSKVQGYMAAGRPVLASVDKDSDTSELVHSGNFGLVVRPGDVDALVEGVQEAFSNTSRLIEWGRNARLIFEEKFSRPIQTAKLSNILLRTIAETRNPV